MAHPESIGGEYFEEYLADVDTLLEKRSDLIDELSSLRNKLTSESELLDIGDRIKISKHIVEAQRELENTNTQLSVLL